MADLTGSGGRRIFDEVGAGSLWFGREESGGGGYGRVGDVGSRGGEWKDAQNQRPRVLGLGPLKGTEAEEAENVRRKEFPETLALASRDGLDVGADEAVVKRQGTEGDDDDDGTKQSILTTTTTTKRPLFAGVCVYINGSTYPHISDHKLKQLLIQHGASISLVLARRSVSHVVVGTSRAGGGGRLSGSKIQKEVVVGRGRGSGIKFVTVEWVLECLRRGKRVSEREYDGLDLEAKVAGGGGGGGAGEEDGDDGIFEAGPRRRCRRWRRRIKEKEKRVDMEVES